MITTWEYGYSPTTIHLNRKKISPTMQSINQSIDQSIDQASNRTISEENSKVRTRPMRNPRWQTKSPPEIRQTTSERVSHWLYLWPAPQSASGLWLSRASCRSQDCIRPMPLRTVDHQPREDASEEKRNTLQMRVQNEITEFRPHSDGKSIRTSNNQSINQTINQLIDCWWGNCTYRRIASKVRYFKLLFW